MQIEAVEAAPAAVSGRRLVSITFALFALFAVATPIALHVAAWERALVVIGGCWLATMAMVAYAGASGLSVRDDHRFVPFWRRLRNERYAWMLDGFGIENPLTTLMALVVLALLVPLIWIVIEAIAPAFFLLLYAAMLPALRTRSLLSIARLTSIAAFAATIVWGIHIL